MSTQISSKLAALAIALMVNSLIIGAAAYLFDGHILQQRSTAVSLAGAGGRGATGSARLLIADGSGRMLQDLT